MIRFRLDSWWFGVPLLTRGPLIALPIVLATDYPAVQTVWVTFILLCFLACQALAWPWKACLTKQGKETMMLREFFRMPQGTRDDLFLLL